MATQGTSKQVTSPPWQQKLFIYLVSLSERIISYLFPIFLLFIEFFLKYAFRTNTQEFIGPTLASVGVGMILTLTTHKECDKKLVLPTELQNERRFVELIENKSLIIQRGSVRMFVNLCWTLTFVVVLVWVVTLVLSINFPNQQLWGWPVHYYPGAASYLTAVALTEIKENI